MFWFMVLITVLIGGNGETALAAETVEAPVVATVEISDNGFVAFVG